MNKLYVGIDVSSKELFASFFDDNSNPVISSAEYPNTPDGWREFSQLLSSLSKDYKIICGVESTGDFHIGILHTLQAMDNIEVHQLNPASVRYFAKALNVSAKTDRIDAQIIARYLATIKPQGDYHVPLFLQRLRHLVRTRRTFIENMASLKNQLYHILRIYFPGYRILVKSGLPISFLHILQRFPSPHLILGAGEEELMKIRVGRQKIRRSIVRKVMEVARSAPIQELTEAEMLIIRTIVRQILEINGVIKEIDREVKEIVEEYYSECKITSIPGIGWVTAGVIIAEAGDIKRRFRNKKKFVGYCGLYPTVWESGDMRRRGKMTNKGNRMLKMAFLLAGVSARRTNPQIRAYYQRLLRRGKSKRAAGGAVARKLAEIVYAIAVSGEEWSLEKAMEGIRRGEEMAMRRMETVGVERRAERPTESSEIDINIF